MNIIEVKPNVCNQLIDNDGNVYDSIRSLARKLGISKSTITTQLKSKGVFRYDGKNYLLTSGKNENQKTVGDETISKEELKQFLKYKDVTNLPFIKYNFNVKPVDGESSRYAVALFSDAHIEETVTSSSVLGLNEYNVDIAEQRIKNYFSSLVCCLNEDKVDTLIFASLGDTISGYIHDELSQTNQLSPLEAIFKAQNLIYNGIKFILENSNIEKFLFIGIVGNHSRTTKKIQHSNGYKMSYEWLMYKNIEQQAKLEGLPVEFLIKESEMAILDTDDNKRFIFIHGYQIHSSGNGTVCGIYPALNRLSMKWDKTFHQDKIYLGHFHSCISIPNAVVNGSIIGYNTFSLTNGFQYEEPAQMYEVFDSKIGQLLTRKIYCK